MPLNDRDFRRILFTIMCLAPVPGCDGEPAATTPKSTLDSDWTSACAEVSAADLCCNGSAGPRIVRRSTGEVCASLLLNYDGPLEAFELGVIQACAAYADPCAAQGSVCAGFRSVSSHEVYAADMCDALSESNL